MKRFTILASALIASAFFGFQSNAAEKEYTVSITKEYASAKFTISFSDDEEYSATIYTPDGKTSYDAVDTEDRTMECIVNETVATGDWKVVIEKEDEPVSGEQAENDNTETGQMDISGVNIKFEGSMEKILDVTKDIKVTTDIVGLQMYFKDDSFVAEWTDTTCGDVNIEVTDEQTMESLAKETVKDRYFELPISEGVKAIVVKIVPAESAQEDGAGKQYTYQVINNPDAVVTYEDTEITNKDNINVHVKLNNSYAVLLMDNDKELTQTETLPAGEYDFDIPTEVGDNNLCTYIIDDSHNMRSTKGYVEKDVVAPLLQLEQEYVQINTQSESIVLEGKVEDYDSFTINDTPVSVEGDHTFKYDYALKEGMNIIDIVAKDKAGNESVYTATVNRIIPEEKPIPWSRIIPFAIIAVLAVLYIYDIVKKNFFGAESNQERKKTGKKSKTGKKQTKTEPLTTEEKKRRMNGFIKDMTDLLAPVILLVILLTQVIQVTVIQSASMEPTLMTGNTVFVNRLAYKTGHSVERGDIVILWSDEYNEYLGKRVIGLPGDEIEFRDGYVVINGQYTDESSYIASDVETNCAKTFTVPDNCYFVLGDNRENSNDSRFWMNPYIPKEDIVGKYMGQIDFSFQYDIFHNF